MVTVLLVMVIAFPPSMVWLRLPLIVVLPPVKLTLPPLAVTAPMVLVPENSSVPPLMVVLPPWLLFPDSVMLPDPVLTRLPLLVEFWIEPPNVLLPLSTPMVKFAYPAATVTRLDRAGSGDLVDPDIGLDPIKQSPGGHIQIGQV